MKFIIVCTILCVLFAFTLSSEGKLFSCKKSQNPRNNYLIHAMQKANTIRFPQVMKTFCEVDRNNFLLKKEKYDFQPIYIGHGATLSRPDAHVFGLEKAYSRHQKRLNAPMKFLDIGSGSGVM